MDDMGNVNENVKTTASFMIWGGLILGIISMFCNWETFGIICAFVAVIGLVLIFLSPGENK